MTRPIQKLLTEFKKNGFEFVHRVGRICVYHNYTNHKTVQIEQYVRTDGLHYRMIPLGIEIQ